MVINATLIVLGCALAACSAVRQGRLAHNRRLGYLRYGKDNYRDRRSDALIFLGLMLAVLGGTSAQHDIGSWAVPVTFVPLYTAHWIPVFLHNRTITYQAGDG
jgi:hypothetical protein